VRRKIDIVSEQHELLYNFEKLNELLRALLGLEANSHPIWTACQIQRKPLPHNLLPTEVQLALENRSDLVALQKIARQRDQQLLQLMRRSVRSVNPVAGWVAEKRIFGGVFADHTIEMQKLRKQLAVFHAAQADVARATVAEHYYSAHKQLQQIQLDRERLESLRKSELRLEAKRQVGPVKVEEVLSVKSDILKARSALIHNAIELQRAWVKMKGAQGLLGQSDEQAVEEVDSSTARRTRADRQLGPRISKSNREAVRLSRGPRQTAFPSHALLPPR
jgi:hypothetical protein